MLESMARSLARALMSSGAGFLAEAELLELTLPVEGVGVGAARDVDAAEMICCCCAITAPSESAAKRQTISSKNNNDPAQVAYRIAYFTVSLSGWFSLTLTSGEKLT